MMVETVVDPTLTHIGAQIASAWIPMGMVEEAAEIQQQGDLLLQLVQQINLLQVASQDGLEMDYAMMSITMWTAVMMVKTVVDPMLTHNTALNANALILMEVAEEEGILLHLLLQVLKDTYNLKHPKVNSINDIQNTNIWQSNFRQFLIII